MTNDKSLVFRFESFEVREREFCLTRSGEVLAVEPRAFRVLLFLLRNPRKLVTKEELLNAVWGDASVTENSLTRSILKLRRALGDDAREPRYIETVSTVGYRFLCLVEVLEETPESAEISPKSENQSTSDSGVWPPNGIVRPTAMEPSRPVAIADGGNAATGATASRRWATRVGRLLSAALVLAACVVAAVLYLHRPSPSLRISSYTQLTNDRQRKAIIGTDGSRLFFNLYAGPLPVLAEETIAGGSIVRVPVELPVPWAYDVSADGTALLVTSDHGDQRALWTVETGGKYLRHLVDGRITSAGWSPDKQFVAYSTANGDISVMRSDGSGTSRVLATVPYRTDNAFFERISWSPDGKRIRFDRNNRIYEASPDGSGAHPFLPGWRPESWQCCGKWSADGKFFFFLGWDLPRLGYPLDPPFQIWALDERRTLFRRGPAEPFQLTSGPTRWGRPVPAMDGKGIFARSIHLDGELVRVDLRTHQLQPYLGGISAEGVSFSPDGKYVAYVTFPEGILWKANRDGGNPTQLTDPPLYPTLPRWSPDGKQILFSAADAGGDFHSYIISPDGGVPRPILPRYEYWEANPNWSPDGRKILLDSWIVGKDTAKRATRILDLASHQATTLPGENWSTLWSPQGRFLAGLTNDTSDLTVFDFQTNRWSILQKGQVGFPAWSHDGQYIYFLRVGEDAGVYRIRPTGSQAERVADLKGFPFTGYVDTWMGLDPEDNPVVLRDHGADDIYALTLEEK